MSLAAQEAMLFTRIVPELEAEGFDVRLRPSSEQLPTFMRDYTPDAIALKKGRNIAVEVLRNDDASKRRLRTLEKLFSGHKDWELQVYWIDRSTTPKPLERVSRSTIEKSIRSLEKLVTNGQYAPAMLMAWAIFEATARTLMPDEFQRPQTPGRLVEILASNGHLTPTEADELRKFVSSRNNLIHGGLETSVSGREIRSFTRILKTLSNLEALV